MVVAEEAEAMVVAQVASLGSVQKKLKADP